MTALIAFVREDAVHVLTDGVASGVDGQVLFHVHKAMPLSNVNAVVATRGPASLLTSAWLSCGHRATFDDAADDLGETLKANAAAQRAVAERNGIASAEACEILLAGWSEREGQPVAWFVSEIERPGLAAFTVTRIYGLASPETDIPLTHDMDPATDGLRIMREQRGCPDLPVGGFCQITTVYRDRIETRILERWPDGVGERMEA